VPEPPAMKPGLTFAVRPADGLVLRATVPVNPLTGAIVIVAVAVWFAITVMLVGLALIVKSVTVSMKLPVDPLWTESPPYAAVIWCDPVLPAAGV